MTNEQWRLCHEHSGICRRVEAIKEEIDLRFASVEKLIPSTSTFVPRQELDLARSRLEEKLDLLISRSAESKGSSVWINHIITVLIGLAVILVVWAIKG